MGQSTEQFAAARLVKAASVISRVSRVGSYFGVRPQKLPNGRLLWPDEPASTEPSPATTNEQAAV